MSVYVDQKYLMMLAPRLGKFARKSNNLYNCRCPICGDSQTNHNKARGYFFKQRNDLFFKCHNCSVSKHFGTFLKDFDPLLFKDYVFERYANGESSKKPYTKPEKIAPTKKPFSAAKTFERLATRVSDLEDTHKARLYCAKRKISADKMKQLYVIRMADVLTIAPQYVDRISIGADRLAMPFYNEKGDLTGMTLRALNSKDLRYIMIKLSDDEDEPLIFGLQGLDKTKPIYVVEGAIDSLFLPNCIACNGISFGKIETLGLPKNKVTVVIDNQPRNKEVCRTYIKYIKAGFKVCIWPETLLEKDLNEMVIAGYDPLELVKEYTSKGLTAQVEFTQWRKI